MKGSGYMEVTEVLKEFSLMQFSDYIRLLTALLEYLGLFMELCNLQIFLLLKLRGVGRKFSGGVPMPGRRSQVWGSGGIAPSH